MNITFSKGLDLINSSSKPISTAWKLSYDLLLLEDKVLKLIDIISEHENLFINHNGFHNHFHLAEVIWSSAFLAKHEGIEYNNFDSMVILLLAATFHDADHKGKSNKVPFEQEKISVFFFLEWWRNNSLFVENILTSKHDDIEKSITFLILNTDFEEGHLAINTLYNQSKEEIVNNVQLYKMAKVLNEADMLLNILPSTGFNKIELILSEAGKSLPENTKWEYFLSFIEDASSSFFSSTACQNLKLDLISKKSSKIIRDSLESGYFGNTQRTLTDKIKLF